MRNPLIWRTILVSSVFVDYKNSPPYVPSVGTCLNNKTVLRADTAKRRPDKIHRPYAAPPRCRRVNTLHVTETTRSGPQSLPLHLGRHNIIGGVCRDFGAQTAKHSCRVPTLFVTHQINVHRARRIRLQRP